MKRIIALLIASILILTFTPALIADDGDWLLKNEAISNPFEPVPLFISHIDPDEEYEGAGVIWTHMDISGGWCHHAAFEPVEAGSNLYRLVEFVPGDGSARRVSVPEGGFVLSANEGNNWPALMADKIGDGSSGEWYDDEKHLYMPNYKEANALALFDLLPRLSVGEVYLFEGLDLSNPVIPTSTPELDYWDPDYKTTATIALASKDANYEAYTSALAERSGSDANGFQVEMIPSVTGRLAEVQVRVSGFDDASDICLIRLDINYDSERMSLNMPVDENNALDCVALPGDAWENLSTVGEDGKIHLQICTSEQSQVLSSGDVVTFSLNFNVFGGYAEAGVWTDPVTVLATRWEDMEDIAGSTCYCIVRPGKCYHPGTDEFDESYTEKVLDKMGSEQGNIGFQTSMEMTVDGRDVTVLVRFYGMKENDQISSFFVPVFYDNEALTPDMPTNSDNSLAIFGALPGDKWENLSIIDEWEETGITYINLQLVNADNAQQICRDNTVIEATLSFKLNEGYYDGGIWMRHDETKAIAWTLDYFKGKPSYAIARYISTTKVVNAVDATCTEKGYTGDEVCEECGAVIHAGSVIPALGHSFTRKDVCNECLKSVANCHAAAVYYYRCEHCDEIGEATYSYGSVNPSNHDGETELRNIKDPTCAAYGNTGDTYCLGCNKLIARGQQIAKLPHTFTRKNTSSKYLKSAADCTHPAVYYYSCFECGEKGTQTFESGEPLGHNYVGVYTKPTRKSNGFTTYTCSRCGDSYIVYDDPDTTIKVMAGDLVGDGKRSARDYMLLKRGVLRSLTLTDEQKAAADLDGDGRITAKDYMLLKRIVLKTAKPPED